MRVISGSARGRQLKGPPSFATRPMTDKLKVALFNTLMSLGVEPERVLDLYAGTGALGIETLSRGATHATFVDKGKAPCATIRWNVEHTGFGDVSDVRQIGVESFIRTERRSFDFIMVDPPYADPEIIPILGQIAESSLVESGTIVVLGHAERVHPPDQSGNLERLRYRCHGDSCFSIYEYVLPSDPANESEADDESMPEENA